MRLLEPGKSDPNLLVGIEDSDDAGVYKLTDEIAMIQSVDFFTPIVDDPYMFGQIAAANALSDIYAMGGTPTTVLNIVAYPIKKLGPEILAEILQGSSDKVKEAGAIVVGGHSIDDVEPKFGLAVTGTVHPEKFYKNSGAQPGDVLVLTKPIGVGVLTTAIKRDLLTTEQIEHVTNVMRSLNKDAAESLTNYHPNAVTDITGFGLLGHAYEMASGSDVSLVINNTDVPLLPDAKQLAKDSIIPAGSRGNHLWLHNEVHYRENIAKYEQFLLCDAMTSGGLLVSLSKQEADSYMHDLKVNYAIEASMIGEVIEKDEKAIYVE